MGGELIDTAAVNQILGGTSALFLLAWLARMFWRKVGRDVVDGARDRAEIDIIMVLREENKLLRERADLAFRERNEAMMELGALRSEVQLLRQNVNTLEARITSILGRATHHREGGK
jgi:FtsZ-binding cell division protein ZapB